jgi:hypothetical protein
MTTCLLLLALLAQPNAEDEVDLPGLVERPATIQSVGELRLSGLARGTDGTMEGFAQVEPSFLINGGERFELNLTAPLRLRILGGGNGVLRQEDWDELSDFGQILQSFQFGEVSDALLVAAGAMGGYSLISGHLVSRYGNQLNANYHPAGVWANAKEGPLRVAAFTSDFLCLRLFGGELMLAPLGLFGAEKGELVHLSVSVAHEFGRAGVPSPPVTLAHADVDVLLVSTGRYEAYVFGGVGARLGEPELSTGAVVGGSFYMPGDALDTHARFELRKHGARFREGFFGPDYEIARVASPGAGAPVAEERFPEGYSAFLDTSLEWDPAGLSAGQRRLRLSVGAEVFTWGRLDFDAALSCSLLEDKQLTFILRFLGAGLRQDGAHYAYGGEARYWFHPLSIYAFANGGKLLSLSRDKGLESSMFASVGMGAEHVW